MIGALRNCSILTLTLFAVSSALAQVNVDGVDEPPPEDILPDEVQVEPLPDSAANNLERLRELAEGTAELPDTGTGPKPKLADNPEPMLRDVSCDRYSFEETRAACLRAASAYFNYRADGLDHRREVFLWQLESSRVIFWVVIGLVLAGIVFAAIQFRAGMKAAYAEPPEGLAEGEEGAARDTGGMVTEFVASMSEIRIRSPIIGVVILVISLAFFYLYLIYVYPITETF